MTRSPPDAPIAASLIDRVTAVRPGIVAMLPRGGGGAIIALFIVLGLIGLAATLATRAIDAKTRAIEADGPAIALARIEAARLRDAIARPGAAATLRALEARLPPAIRLAAVERTEAGILRITIDAADPDQLRAALAADPWLAAFRARAQDQRADGGFRVTLERGPGGR